jgi:large subunit ribosomal protein L21
MYAIFRAQGKQFKAEKGKTIKLPRMEAEPGSKVTFDDVLLTSDGETIKTGTPTVKGAKVEAEVVGETKGEKIYVFKFKRPEELSPEDRASGEVHRGPHHQRHGLRRHHGS